MNAQDAGEKKTFAEYPVTELKVKFSTLDSLSACQFQNHGQLHCSELPSGTHEAACSNHHSYPAASRLIIKTIQYYIHYQCKYILAWWTACNNIHSLGISLHTNTRSTGQIVPFLPNFITDKSQVQLCWDCGCFASLMASLEKWWIWYQKNQTVKSGELAL